MPAERSVDLAFIVRRRSMVHTMHDHVIRNGDTVIHPPQRFPQYPGHYYATFWYATATE